MRRLASPALILAFAAALPVAGQHAGKPAQPQISCAGPTTIDFTTGDTIFKPDARLEDGDLLMTADEIRYSSRTGLAIAIGHVTATLHADRLLADRLEYQRSDGTFFAKSVRIGTYPFYIQGSSAEGSSKEVVIHKATIVYREPGSWQPNISASTIYYSPGHYLRIGNSFAGVGSARPLPVIRFRQDLTRQPSVSYVTIDGGSRGDLGLYAEAAMHWPIATGFTAGPDLGIYTKRGFMAGPVADYDFSSGGSSVKSILDSGFIHDFDSKDRLDDVVGKPVPANRAYLTWNHKQVIDGDFTVDGSVNWWKDSEVIRDFRPKEFVNVQDPDNFLEAAYTGRNYFISVFTRFQPDVFFPVQRRLPEIRFDLLPTAIGGGLYERFGAGLASLRENPPEQGLDLASKRLDAFYGLSRPVSYRGWLDFYPVVGARFTDYRDTRGAQLAGGAARTLGELGFDADLKSSATFNYKNPVWQIDGIRHLLTPTLSYRYIPNADKAAAAIPEIDRNTFSGYLPILELGDMRALDQLQAENVLRLGLKNTIQTRDPAYGSRDLLRFDVDDDIRFKRAPGQGRLSELHTELEVIPAKWLEFSAEDTFSSRSYAQKELNANVTLRDADVWSVAAGVGYLTDNYGRYAIPGVGTFPITGLDAYHFETKFRVNEAYQVFARIDYDDRAHVFADQYYGVYQRLANTWIVQYTLSIQGGPGRNNGVGFNVNLEIAHF